MRCPAVTVNSARVLDVLPVQRHRGAQIDGVGSGDRREPVVAAAHPGHHVAVVEAQPQVHAHGHGAGDALHDAHHVGGVPAGWHEVDDADRSLLGVPFGCQDQRVVPVVPSGRLIASGGGQAPPSGVGTAEQCGEAGRGVEPWQAQPVHGAVAADQGGGLQVAEQRVVLDAGHGQRASSSRVMTTLTSSGPAVNASWARCSGTRRVIRLASQSGSASASASAAWW